MNFWLAREILFSLLESKVPMRPRWLKRHCRRTLEQEVSAWHRRDLILSGSRPRAPQWKPAMEERVKFLSGDALRNRILQAFRDFVRAHALKQPLVLVWEDLHWCDSSSLQVLERIMPLTAELPLLLFCATRPDESRVTELLTRAREAHAANYRSIELSPLTRQQSGSLIQELLRIRNLPEEMRDRILDRAEGNPFFLGGITSLAPRLGSCRDAKGGRSGSARTALD